MNFLEKYNKDFEEYDKMDKDFIDDDKIWAQLNAAAEPSKEDVRAVLKKAEKKIEESKKETPKKGGFLSNLRKFLTGKDE